MGPKLPSAGAHKYDRLIRIASKYRWQLGAGDVGCAALELCAWAQLGSRGPGRHTQHMETRPKRRRQAAQAQVREPLSWVKGTSTCCLTEPMHTHACMQPPAAHHRRAMAQPPVSLEDVWLGECACEQDVPRLSTSSVALVKHLTTRCICRVTHVMMPRSRPTTTLPQKS